MGELPRLQLDERLGTVFGLPVGMSFVGTAFSEQRLITLASGFEAAAKARIVPQFLPTLPVDQAPPRDHPRGRTDTLKARPRPAALHI